MQSNTPQSKTEVIKLFALEKEDIWIKASFAKDLVKLAQFQDLRPGCGRRVRLLFPDYVNVVSKVFLIALISDVCKNFENIHQFREVVSIDADPITTRDFWKVVRESFGLENPEPEPWYKRLLNKLR